MQKLFIALVGLVMLFSVSVNAKEYLIFDVGSMSDAGSDGYKELVDDTATNAGVTVTSNDSTVTHKGTFSRFAYGISFNKKIAFEIGKSNLGEAIFYQKYSFGASGSVDEEGTPFSVSATDISFVYSRGMNDKFRLTVRLGSASYEWDVDADVAENPDITSSGRTTLLGFGAKYNKFHLEYRIYNIPYTLKAGDKEYKFAGSTNVTSFGYKYEF